MSGVAVDRGAGDGGVDEPDVDLGQAGLPGDRPLGLAQRLALHAVDELLELRLADRLLRLLALLAVGRGEALDELAGDADDDLGRAEAGHLLGFLERDRAVVDDGRDVGDGARLHVREALALAARRRGPCRAPARRSRTRAPWRTRCPTSSAVQADSSVPWSRCQMRRQKVIYRPVVARRGARASIGRQRLADAFPARCPRPGPSRAGRRRARRSPARPA